MISIAVLMVTGGWNTAGERTISVELLNLDGSRNCSLPPLPEARGWFTTGPSTAPVVFRSEARQRQRGGWFRN